jgi:multidrug efflux system membrane fusion protein
MDEPVNRTQPAPAHTVDGGPRAQPPRRFRGFLIFLVLVLVAGWFVHRRLQTASPPSNPRGRGGGAGEQSVRTAPATVGDMPLTLDALGTVTSLDTVNVQTQVAGKLVAVDFAEGQMVKAGDVLAQIDPRPFQAALEQAQATLQKDTAALAQARADLARYQLLIKQDSISKQQAQDQQYLVLQDQAAMAVDQANVDAANLNLSFARITSPITGLTGLRQVDVGNYLQASSTTPVVVVAQLEPISVVFAIPQQALPQVRARMKAGAQLPVDARDQTDSHVLASGVLSAVDSQIATSTGTVNLKASFPNADDVLFPNQFVNIRVTVDTVKGAVLAPSQAIQRGAPGTFVYLVDANGTVHVQKVQTGASDATNTVVSSGLSAGQAVVVDGADRLTDGGHVVVRNTDQPPAAGVGTATGKGGGAAGGRRRRQGAGPASGAGTGGEPPAGGSSSAGSSSAGSSGGGSSGAPRP